MVRRDIRAGKSAEFPFWTFETNRKVFSMPMLSLGEELQKRIWQINEARSRSIGSGLFSTNFVIGYFTK